MRRFEYYEPTSLDEAVQLLGQHNGEAQILAGGTDLLVELKEQIRWPKHVVNIKKIPGLDRFSFDEMEGLQFGALVTTRTLETSPIITEHYYSLHQAFTVFASIQVRNRATVAGNVCRASPSAESSPPLVADEAKVKIYGPQGEREVPIEAFFKGPGKTVLAPDEILTAFQVPAPSPHTGKFYIKHGRRKAMELATVGVAVTLTVDGDVCRQARIALGAVAPTPIRAKEAEGLLEGQRLDAKSIQRAAQAAYEVAKPISDVRASEEYRHDMVRVLTARAIRSAGQRASAAETGPVQPV